MSYSLFSCVGIEIELMIVDVETLDVRPLADRVLRSPDGRVVSELEVGPLAWSNELVAHVVELKTNGPAAAIDTDLLAAFVDDVDRIARILAEHGARLLPTAMHPWMEPVTEATLWQHEHGAVYRAYDRIFGCQGHGWSNLQSLHLNLPFAGDRDFARLHSAIRLLLPMLPALAASSPLVEGRFTGILDNRMHFYGGNSARVPSVVGAVVPEPVLSRADYQRLILSPMYDDIAPLDPQGILRQEFLNSRGAIARFDRGSIEIRVIDSQECPRADLSIAAGVVAVLRLLVDGSVGPVGVDVPMQPLVDLLNRTIRDGARAQVEDASLLALWGIPAPPPVTAGEVWRQWIERSLEEGLLEPDPWGSTLLHLVDMGPLAERIHAALGSDPSRPEIADVYCRLADCLRDDQLFEPHTRASRRIG